MVVLVAALCFAALIWILMRRRSPGLEQSFANAEAFDGAISGDLFETAPIGYLEIDRHGVVRRVNRLECKLRGLEQSAIVGVHCADLIPEIERDRYREHIQRKIEGHTALVTYQREYLHENGHRVAVEIHEQFLKNAAGVIVGMRMASVDITERKNSEDAAYQNAAELR